MEKGLKPWRSAIVLTRMLVEVPMSVQTPPNIEANDNGISSREGLMFADRLTSSTIGSRIATTAVLLMKAEKAPATIIVSRIASQENLRPIRVNSAVAAFKAPVRDRPALSTNIAATVTVAGLPRPERPCSGVTTRVTMSAMATKIAVRSTGSFSVDNT